MSTWHPQAWEKDKGPRQRKTIQKATSAFVETNEKPGWKLFENLNHGSQLLDFNSLKPVEKKLHEKF